MNGRDSGRKKRSKDSENCRFYQHLIAKDKPAKPALTAVMRKLIVRVTNTEAMFFGSRAVSKFRAHFCPRSGLTLPKLPRMDDFLENANLNPTGPRYS